METPPVIERARGERLGLAEWTVGLTLLFSSLPGPWLTLVLPAALAFAVYDRRPAVRAVAVLMAALCTLLTAAMPGGAAFIAMAAGAMSASLVAVARGRQATLAALVAPVLAGAAVGLAAGFALAPAAVAAWEGMLRQGIADGGTAALSRYRDLGMDTEAVAALEAMLGTVAEWTVRLWPAWAALALWLGAWLGWRLLARWGRPAPALAARLAGRPFAEFGVGVPVVWVLIAGLGGLWIPPLERAAVNGTLVAVTLFALDGLAVLWWWLARRRGGIVLPLVGLSLAFVFALPLATAAVLVLGLVDVWIGFRDRAERAGSAP